ncbi:hypothetical protein HGA88_06050 [Candidatus Roizmanbacteria bacterium]|nr:hypothetical protein [Candidatus Roizmanbacteria bacterium]
MQKFPVVLDLETKYTFRDFSDHKKLGISVGVIFDYSDNQPKVYFEKDIPQMFPILEKASYIIGYNVRSFDIPVLSAYYPGDTSVFEVFDILDDIKEKIGRRIALNDVIHATLGKKKTGHGLMAIDYYKEGKFEELSQYCTDDVTLTRDLFEYGIEHGEIFYMNELGKIPIKVDWKKYKENQGKDTDMPLTLPF